MVLFCFLYFIKYILYLLFNGWFLLPLFVTFNLMVNSVNVSVSLVPKLIILMLHSMQLMIHFCNYGLIYVLLKLWSKSLFFIFKNLAPFIFSFKTLDKRVKLLVVWLLIISMCFRFVLASYSPGNCFLDFLFKNSNLAIDALVRLLQFLNGL